MTYTSIRDAQQAIREFNGANAHGQPISLTLIPTAPAASIVDQNSNRGRGRAPAVRNPFDTAIKPGRSLFERIENPPADDRRGGGRARRSRSRSPGAPRRTNTSKPAPEGVDRYVPSPMDSRNGRRRRSRARSAIVRGRGSNRDRDDGGKGRTFANGRPRKTQEELDMEMEDYWGGGKGDDTGNANGAPANGAPVADDGDIDMIE